MAKLGVFFVVVILMATMVWAVTPDPGHDASSVGPGTFALGNFTFPMSLTITDNLFLGGIFSATTLQGNLNASYIQNAPWLLSFSETDPFFTASVSSNITSGQISNWDTAFSWGNHSLAGYLTTETDPFFIAENVSIWGAINARLPLSGGTMSGNIDMNSKNVTGVDCVVFQSGGKICTGV